MIALYAWLLFDSYLVYWLSNRGMMIYQYGHLGEHSVLATTNKRMSQVVLYDTCSFELTFWNLKGKIILLETIYLFQLDYLLYFLNMNEKRYRLTIIKQQPNYTSNRKRMFYVILLVFQNASCIVIFLNNIKYIIFCSCILFQCTETILECILKNCM